MRSLATLLLLGLSSLLAGCVSPLKVQADAYEAAELLVLPPRDAHPRPDAAANSWTGAGSGAQLGRFLLPAFERAGWKARVEQADGDLGHARAIGAEAALARGRASGASYVLTVELGEIWEAPQRNRMLDDYVDLDAARLHDCGSGQVVWELAERYRSRATGSEDGSVSIRDIAERIAQSIAQGAAGSVSGD